MQPQAGEVHIWSCEIKSQDKVPSPCQETTAVLLMTYGDLGKMVQRGEQANCFKREEKERMYLSIKEQKSLNKWHINLGDTVCDHQEPALAAEKNPYTTLLVSLQGGLWLVD